MSPGINSHPTGTSKYFWLVLSVKAHAILSIKIRMQGKTGIQLGEKNKGCKKKWRKAKVTKSEGRGGEENTDTTARGPRKTQQDVRFQRDHRKRKSKTKKW